MKELLTPFLKAYSILTQTSYSKTLLNPLLNSLRHCLLITYSMLVGNDVRTMLDPSNVQNISKFQILEPRPWIQQSGTCILDPGTGSSSMDPGA